MKISVITVTFNSEKFLNTCLDSIQSQIHNDIDHIIIDGESTDNTLSILNSRTNHYTSLISEPDKGIYDAMNKGIKIAKGDVIGFLNSDDFYANENVLLQVSKIFEDNPSLDACYSDLVYIDKKNISQIVRYWKSDKFIPGLFSKGWSPPHPTFFVRRSIYNRLGGFDINYSIASDVDLMMRFLENHKIKSIYIPEVWIKMRMGGKTNKNLKNIIIQNQEILHSLRNNRLPSNFMIFFINKFFTRLKQYLTNPKK